MSRWGARWRDARNEDHPFGEDHPFEVVGRDKSAIRDGGDMEARWHREPRRGQSGQQGALPPTISSVASDEASGRHSGAVASPQSPSFLVLYRAACIADQAYRSITKNPGYVPHPGFESSTDWTPRSQASKPAGRIWAGARGLGRSRRRGHIRLRASGPKASDAGACLSKARRELLQFLLPPFCFR